MTIVSIVVLPCPLLHLLNHTRSIQESTKKQCIQSWMTLLREEIRVIPASSFGAPRQIAYHVYQYCSEIQCRNSPHEGRFQAGTGYFKPLNPLFACYKSLQKI